MSGGVKDVIDNAGKLVEILEKVGLLDRIKAWISGSDPADLLLLGVSGTGKSSFRDHIFGTESEISRYDRTTASSSTLGKLRGTLLNVIDTPGQETDVYREERRKAIFEAQRSKRLGIINVVSYGYHEGVTRVATAIDDAHAREEYLNARRAKESDQLSEWVPILCGEGGSAKWIITLVTKADLWWTPNTEQETLLHYVSGEYAQKLGPAQRKKHTVVPYCSINKLFYGVAPMTGFYSDDRKNDDHLNLVAHVLSNCATTK